MHLTRLQKTIEGFKNRLSIVNLKRLEILSAANMEKVGGVLRQANDPQIGAELLNLKPKQQLGNLDVEFKQIEEQMTSPIDESKVDLMLTDFKSKTKTKKRDQNYLDTTAGKTVAQSPKTNPLLYAERHINSTTAGGSESRSGGSGGTKNQSPMILSRLPETRKKQLILDRKLLEVLRN